MPIINHYGYVSRRTSGHKKGSCSESKVYRNWWLVKYGSPNRGYVDLGMICLPKKYIGKKVRFKIEIMEGFAQ